MPIYDVTEHPLLTMLARNIADNEPDVFETVAAGAEAATGLSSRPAFTGKDLGTARLALVYTVNRMVLVDPNADVIESETVAKDRTRKYRERASADLVAHASRPLLAQLGVVIPPTEAAAPVQEEEPWCVSRRI